MPINYIHFQTRQKNVHRETESIGIFHINTGNSFHLELDPEVQKQCFKGQSHKLLVTVHLRPFTIGGQSRDKVNQPLQKGK